MNKNELISRFAENEDDRYLLAGILDKATERDGRNIITSTRFLTEREQHIAESMLRSEHEDFLFWGGFPDAERKIAVFLPDYYAEDDLYSDPSLAGLTLLRIAPDKFYKETGLTHRDYLGSLLALGTERENIGDIIVKDGGAELVCLEPVAKMVEEQLLTVGKYKVSFEKIGKIDFSSADLKESVCNVSSLRLDAVTAEIFNLSRGTAAEKIAAGLVTVGGAVVTKNDYAVKENDRIALRGKGKVIYAGLIGETKKGRLNIRILRYT